MPEWNSVLEQFIASLEEIDARIAQLQACLKGEEHV